MRTVKYLIVLSLIGSLSFVIFSCTPIAIKEEETPTTSKKELPSKNEAVATFAGGCFWYSEIVFQSLVGVREAISGYAGGKDPHPDYEKLSAGKTDQAEAVEVYYDPSQISYETLVKAFFASQDSTTMKEQENDTGKQCRSIAFYRSEQEKQIIEAEIKRLYEQKKYVTTAPIEVTPYTVFYKAEDYLQEFTANNPDNFYVKNVSIPDFTRFKRTFPGKFK